MKKIPVRCWEVKNYRLGKAYPDCLFITYPESDNGHDLITCLNCGEIYAVTIVKEVYLGPPLEEKIKGLNCVSCGKPLKNNYASYPDLYIADGKQYAYSRDMVLPSDSQSIVKEFYGIYE